MNRRASIMAMIRVADWQLAHPKHRDVEWHNATLFAGVLATHYTTHEQKYLRVLLEMGNRNHWNPGPRPRHADDHAIGQTYLELYLILKDDKMIKAIRQTIDAIMDKPRDGRADWWWCDALFMAPPVISRLAAAVGNNKYLDFMNVMWWDVVGFLYDQKEHLFFRDQAYLVNEEGCGPRENNGHKIFWGRGNGWVMSGIVRVLQFMPEDYLDRERYITLLREMSKRILGLQCEDGLWRSSLLDPKSYPGGEVSGSGLFCYALAWGINHGILDPHTHVPVVTKAWSALNRCVDKSGRLGWVQQPGKSPASVCEHDTEVYGTGAFLLAGSEMARLLE